MVYWLFSSFVTETLKMLLEKVIEYGTESYASGSDADKKLDQLKTTLLGAQSLINQAESRHASDDYAWQHLLQKLEAAAYDADDLIDEIAIQVSKREPRNRKHKDLVSKLVLSLYKRKEAPNMTQIQSELERLLREIDSLCNRQRDPHGRPLEMIENKLQQTTCLIDYPVFGRESDQRNVINMLVASEQSSRTKNVSIVPIVGMMGVGKTTLAQLVYNNYPGTTEAHPFSLKMWVSVTTPFDVMRLTRSILEAATEAAYRGGASTSNFPNRDQLSDLNSLHVRLKEILEGNKFMLVLDDLWNLKRTEWNLLFRPLRGGAKGSTIIVTTESHRVVSWLVGAATPYCLQRLSDEDCWLVFKNEALEDMNLDAFPEFEMIGRKIAKKCDGSPLVAKLIGMHLYQTLDENQWNNVLKNFSSLIRNEVSPALKWGYHRLPSHVRHCFAYCSMFPQGYDLEKDKIVQMWIAEGFIIPDKEGKLRIEDVGNEYFHQLCSKSFFQMEREKYKMHC